MSDTLIDKMKNMERRAILEADNKLSRRIHDLTKAGIAREDLNLKIEEIQGIDTPQFFEFTKYFNIVYQQLSQDANTARDKEDFDDLVFDVIGKPYNILMGYINGPLKYNRLSQSNKRKIDEMMITLVPLLQSMENVLMTRHTDIMTDMQYDRYLKMYQTMINDLKFRIYKPVYVPAFGEMPARVVPPVVPPVVPKAEDEEDGEEEDGEEEGDEGDKNVDMREMADYYGYDEDFPIQYAQPVDEEYDEGVPIQYAWPVEEPRQRNMEDMGQREQKYREEPPKRRKGPISKRGDIPNSDFYDKLPNLDNFDEYVLGNGKGQGRKGQGRKKVTTKNKDIAKLLKLLNIKLK